MFSRPLVSLSEMFSCNARYFTQIHLDIDILHIDVLH